MNNKQNNLYVIPDKAILVLLIVKRNLFLIMTKEDLIDNVIIYIIKLFI